ncbi:MAG: GntR family transcriptional regulator [Halanaerobiales bacterium]
MQIKFDAAKPIYEQIIEEIKKMIVRGEMAPGDKLPSQRSLAKKIEVNPNTIQRAYREMENMGLIKTKRGLGTFVEEDERVVENIKEEMADNVIQYFVEEMFSLGFSSDKIINLLEEYLTNKREGDNSE